MDIFNTAVILAGGKSGRMGFDKQLLTLEERSLYELMLESLHNIFDDIVVISNTPELYRNAPVRVFSDEFTDMGPLAGIHAALKYAKSRYVYLIACDMPVIRTDYIRYMMEILRKTRAQICVTRRNGKIEPFNAFYSTDLLSDAEQRLQNGSTSLFRFISAADTVILQEEEVAPFNTGLDMFTNLNTRSEYLDFLEKKKK